MPSNERISRILSWSVHLFTASGGVFGFFAIVAIASGQFPVAAVLMLLTLFIDGIDGTLARAARVTEHVPQIDGRRLDDIVDYTNFVIVPACFMWGAGTVTHPLWLVLPILASSYGFSRHDAKTKDDFFLGFPSYWNILAIYLWLLGIGPVGGTIWIVVLSIAVFVPIKYVYPSKVQPISLRIALGVGALVWTGALIAGIAWPLESARYFLIEISLIYPAWYLWLSFTRGGFVRPDSMG
jgi:phosphatidylcholine synthase